MIDWITVSDALQAWVVASSGLSAGSAIWAQQPGPRPLSPWISMRIMAVETVGHDFVTMTDNGPGAVLETVRGVRRMTLSLQAFGALPVSANPEIQAVSLLSDVVSSTRLTTYVDALRTAGMNVIDYSAVQSIDGNLGAIGSNTRHVASESFFEPRAIATIRLGLVQEISIPGNYIQIVEISGEASGQGREFTVRGPDEAAGSASGTGSASAAS